MLINITCTCVPIGTLCTAQNPGTTYRPTETSINIMTQMTEYIHGKIN